MASRAWFREAGMNCSVLSKYAKSVLGYGAKSGLKMPRLVCLALEKEGRLRPSGVSERRWILDNATHIKVVAKAIEKNQTPRCRALAQYSGDVNADAFLSSYEWRRVRMVALKKYGSRCQCCGATPQTGATIHVDHIKPRRLFPDLALDADNLQVLCHECNHGKGNWDQTDWRREEVSDEVRDFIRSIAGER